MFGEGSTIESNVNQSIVQVSLDRLEASRINDNSQHDSITFNVDVKMEERNRTNDELILTFHLTIDIKPSLAKFDVIGTARITGNTTVFNDVLQMDEITRVPKVLHTIYQRVFISLYLLSSMIDTPYPPPDLLHSYLNNKNVTSVNLEDYAGSNEMEQDVQTM